MPRYVCPTAARRALAGACVLMLLAGCSWMPDKHLGGAPPTIETARPAVSPATTVTPAGTVRPLAGIPQAALVDPDTASLVVLVGGDTPSLQVLGSTSGTRVIPLPKTAPTTALAAAQPGTVLLTTRGGYLTVDLRAGTVTRIDIDGQANTDFTAIARRADGRLLLGTVDGTLLLLAGPAQVAHSERIFARVDAIVTQGDIGVVLDRGQTSVTAVNTDGSPGEALRAGEGATTMVADSAGRVLVTDTRGGELLVFGTDPLIMRQRYPVHSSPFGLAGSAALAWVSTTVDNKVTGYDLSTGIPVQRVQYPTVSQPDLLAHDATTDTLYVVSTTGAGVQVIAHASRP